MDIFFRAVYSNQTFFITATLLMCGYSVIYITSLLIGHHIFFLIIPTACSAKISNFVDSFTKQCFLFL